MEYFCLQTVIHVIFAVIYLFYSSDGVSIATFIEKLASFTATKDILENHLFTNKCAPDLGCFYNGPPWYNYLQRPFSPEPNLEKKARFDFYSPENRGKKYNFILTQESLKNSTFNSSLQTKVLIHGYQADLDDDDFRFIIKEHLLDQGDYNVFIVNWTQQNQPPYSQAVANTRPVGARVANLIHFLLNNTEAKSEDFHLIGHSLGAHVAGYAGKRVPNLGRITGLDPAGPFFNVIDKRVRLARTDANFVDIIHTSSAYFINEGLGIYFPIGHQDFFPNGGNTQPGCGPTGRITEKVLGVDLNSSMYILPFACNHQRSNQLFIESITQTNCTFVGLLCSNYGNYLNKNCNIENSRHAVMGFFAEPIPDIAPPSKFYLTTNLGNPFCMKDESISL